LKFWERKREVPEAGRGVAQAALDGASRLEIAGEALRELRADGQADRIGIWLACTDDHAGYAPRLFAVAAANATGTTGTTSPTGTTSVAGAASVRGATNTARGQESWEAASAVIRARDCAWRGVVWDDESESTPAEWLHLSGEAPLPQEVLFGGVAVEQELDPGGQPVLIGILIELQKVLWVPIGVRGRLQGVILCGARSAQTTLGRATALRVAAELALYLAWEGERALARERQADMALTRRIHAQLGPGGHAEVALKQLADSIVSAQVTGDPLGIGAAFASIGIWSGQPPAFDHGANEARGTVDFRWKSGDADWLRLAESAAMSETWQEALRLRRTMGTAPQALWMHTAITRIVAVPIEINGELCGVLVAGLFPRGASLAALERLEYRAVLAGLLLARRNREHADARTARRQRMRLASSSECLFVLDELGRVAELSAAAEELIREEKKPTDTATGTPPAVNAVATSIGAPLTFFFQDADRRAVEDWLQRDVESTAEKWNPAEKVLDADLRNGVSVRLSRGLPSAQGHSVAILAKLDRQQVAAEVGNNERALEGVIEWLEEGVVLFDTQENVRAHNTRFEQLAGLGPLESAKGATLDALIARMEMQAADPAKFAKSWRALASGIEGGVRDELRMTQPSPRILERAARPVFDALGRKLGRVEVYRDLTAQRLFQSQLLQTEKLAALGQMISGVAHELSNPLTSILGYAQRLLLRPDVGGRLPEVRQIFQEAERAAGILRQLLFSARETPPERRRVALNQVVLRSMELQRFSLATEKVSMELDLDPGLPVVLGDAAQLQQVLMNLVGNARQALEQKGQGGRIRVRTKQVAERRVQLEIEDDGPGVPQSILARIFDPFFTTKAEGVGTGLGLSIVLSIVREHGGRVNVQNAPQGGAIFSIELPVAEGVSAPPPWPAGSFERELAIGTAGATAVPLAMNSGPARPRRALRGRVLVMEDEPTVARLIADVLQDEGLIVEVLLDGREGLRRAAEHRFDLVVCDMRMPGMDGQEFYRGLVKSGNALQHSFLFVTGDVIAPATQTFLERNHLPHLAKPFRVEELTERVREVLENNTAGAGSIRATGEMYMRKKFAGQA
jgi:signal transduction histidine kinase/ActR/RegA family two-component response regulator